MNSHPARRPAVVWPVDRFSPSARRRHRRVTSALALVAASRPAPTSRGELATP